MSATDTHPDSEDGAEGRPPEDRPADKICWRCVFAALPPLLLTLLFAWFAASALERGRVASEAEVGASAELLDDVDLANEALRSELASAKDELAAARAAMAAAGDGDTETLIARIADLPEQERAALLSRAGADLAPAPSTPQQAIAALEALEADSRADFFSALPALSSFSAWFETLPPAEKRQWLERILGDGSLDAIEIGGQRSPAGRELLEQRRAEIDGLRNQLAEATEQTRVVEVGLTREREKIAELQALLKQESENRSDAQIALGRIRSDSESADEAARRRETALNAALAGLREDLAAARSELEASARAGQAETERADRAEASLQRARESYDRNLEIRSAAIAEAENRAERAEAALERARDGLDETLEASAGGDDAPSAPRATAETDPSIYLAALSSLPGPEKTQAYERLATGLSDAPDFKRWLEAEASPALRARFAAPTPAPEPAVDAEAEAEALEDLETALNAAEQARSAAERRAQTLGRQLDEARSRLRAADAEVDRLAAELASSVARIATARADASQQREQLRNQAGEIEGLRASLDAARKQAALSTREEAAAASSLSAEAETRIRELQAALERAPDAGELAALRRETESLREQLARRDSQIESLQQEALSVREALDAAIAGRTAASAALARVDAEKKALSTELEAALAARAERRPASVRRTEPGGAALQGALTLPEIGAVPVAEAPRAVTALLSARDADLRALRAALAAERTRQSRTELELPEIGAVSAAAAPQAVADLLADRDGALRGLRAANAALQTRLAAAPTAGPAPSPAARSTTLTLPEIGPIAPEKAPEAVADLLATRDRELKALKDQKTALETRLAGAAPKPRTPRAAAPAKDANGVAAVAVYPAWRAADDQAIDGESLEALSDPIAFRSASAKLTREGRKAVKQLARRLTAKLKQAPDQEWRLVIEGHTDQRPIHTKEFPSNWDLSAARAAAVAYQLNRYGVPQSRLAAVGLAATRPVDKRWTRGAFAKNRRIELSLLDR